MRKANDRVSLQAAERFITGRDKSRFVIRHSFFDAQPLRALASGIFEVSHQSPIRVHSIAEM